MKALLQRVTEAAVRVEGEVVGEIESGLLVFLGVTKNDTKDDVDKLLHKIFNYRIFPDDQQKMNLSVQGSRGGLLIVSQFTLAAETQKGMRPGFSTAALPHEAKILYEYFISQARLLAKECKNVVETGVFGADMKVSLVNDGPVTFMLET
ncbi:MAG: D-aminoacyl-tRNA deacylase [Cellvibrionaceae bacterium]